MSFEDYIEELYEHKVQAHEEAFQECLMEILSIIETLKDKDRILDPAYCFHDSDEGESCLMKKLVKELTSLIRPQIPS